MRLAFRPVLLLTAFTCFLELNVTAQDQAFPTFLDRLYIEAGGGGYAVPDLILKFSNDVKKSPDELRGTTMFLSGGIELAKNRRRTFSLNARFFKQEAVGYGPWQRSTGDPEQDAFDAEATGTTHFATHGLIFLGREEFVL